MSHWEVKFSSLPFLSNEGQAALQTHIFIHNARLCEILLLVVKKWTVWGTLFPSLPLEN